MGKRKPTPVQVIVFHKKTRARTQTVPEIATVLDDVVTEVDADPRERTHAKSPSGRSRVAPQEEATNAESEMISLGHELFELGRVKESKIVFEGLAVTNPDNAFVQTMLGAICLSLNDLQRGAQHFERALTLDPHDVAALVYRGEIRLHHGKDRQAAQDFERALNLAAEGDPFVERAQRLLRLARRGSRSSKEKL